MKKILIIIAFSALALSSCRTIEYPTLEECRRDAKNYSDKLAKVEKKIQAYAPAIPESGEIVVELQKKALDELALRLSNSSDEDISITFLEKKGFLEDNGNLAGLKYKNFLDINGGNLKLDLKKFKFDKLDSDRLYGMIEIEGKGRLSVSGKYAGIPASASPEVEVYLCEPIAFKIKTGENAVAQLVPERRTLLLKVKLYIKMLEWRIPWYEEIPLELTDVVKPINIPLALSSSTLLPLPVAGMEGVKNTEFRVSFLNPKITLRGGEIRYGTDIELKRAAGD